MPVLLALTPIAAVLVLMVVLRWPAALAGLVGLAAALCVAVFGFPLGGTGPGAVGAGAAVAGAMAEAVFVALTIVWIILPALCIYELQLASGGFGILRSALARLSDDPRILAVLIAWFFALFMEGAAGFGTPVALAAPILVSLGFSPLTAVTVALIGHAAGVSFGAVGTPVIPQVADTAYTGAELARATGLLHGLLGWILLVFVVWIARGPGQSLLDWRAWLWTAVAAACFLVPFTATAFLVGPELPTLAGALIGGALFIALLRLRRDPAPGVPAVGGHAVAMALAPYLVLLVLILATRLNPTLQALLRDVVVDWRLPGGFAGSVQPLYHPGTMLLLGFIVGGLLQGRDGGDLWRAAGRALRRLPIVMLALVAMLGIARLMIHAGMITTLAEAAAAGLGPVWPWLAPAVGVLGTFVTGSATASNILLTGFQDATAARLGLAPLWLVAAQAFGAAVGNIVCPHNIIAGSATVGLQGREGDVLRRTVIACLCYALAGGALVSFLLS